VKIASHAKFDERMNDIPIDKLPPNSLHLQQSEFGKPIAPDPTDLNTTNFECRVSPFDKILTKTVFPSCNSPTFGFDLNTDAVNGRTYIHNILPHSSAYNCFGTLSKNN